MIKGRKVKGLHVQGCTGGGVKIPKTYKGIVPGKDSLTAEDGLCEFLSNSLISLAVRFFLLC